MMNKRIQKLFNEAGFHQPEMERLGIEDKFEKFAKLIVRECADIAKHNVMNISTYADAEFVEEQIQKHFGVEE